MMLGFEYILAAIRIMIHIGFAVVTAIPLSISWNCIAPKYLVPLGLPLPFEYIPFWHTVAFLLCTVYIGEYFNKLIPTLIHINNSSEKEAREVKVDH